MNFLYAVLIGAVIGLIGGFLLRSRHPNAIVLGPALAIAGSVIASVLATIFGDADYGPKEFILQVVLAIIGVGVVYYLASRSEAQAS